MPSLISNLAFATSLVSLASASSLDPKLAVYYGQGANQNTLDRYCTDDTLDIIPIGFVTAFAGNPGSVDGYPALNFGNKCWAGGQWVDPEGNTTNIFANCVDMIPSIQYCQSQGKKVLLSMGGGASPVYFESEEAGSELADFLWSAFGPYDSSYTGPRPFGNDIVLDGFDLDIQTNTRPNNDGLPIDTGIIPLAKRFRAIWGDNSPYLLTAAPQCIVPDAINKNVLAEVEFDAVWIQFYNTPICSARAFFDPTFGDVSGNSKFSYDLWAEWLAANSANPDIKAYVGLPAATTSSNDPRFYLSIDEVKTLVADVSSKHPTLFGGVMLWEMTSSANNTDSQGRSYAQRVKAVLKEISSTPMIRSVWNNWSTTVGSTTTPVVKTTTTSSVSGIVSTTGSTSGTVSTQTTVSTSSSSSVVRTSTTSGSVSVSTTTGVIRTSTTSGSVSMSTTSGRSSTTSSSVSQATTSTASRPTASVTSSSSSSKPTTLTTQTSQSSGQVWDQWTAATTPKAAATTSTAQEWNQWSASTTTSKPLKPTATNTAVWQAWNSDVTVTAVTTSYVSVGSTGYTTVPLVTTITITDTESWVWPTETNGYPEGFTVTSTVCDYGCGTQPTTVTITVPIGGSYGQGGSPNAATTDSAYVSWSGASQPVAAASTDSAYASWSGAPQPVAATSASWTGWTGASTSSPVAAATGSYNTWSGNPGNITTYTGNAVNVKTSGLATLAACGLALLLL